MGRVNRGSMLIDSCCAELAKWKSVLDLPGPWLLQLLSCLDRNSLLALFRACKAFRDLVLRWAPENSQLTLQPAWWGVAQSIRALQLAHQHGGRASRQLVCLDTRYPPMSRTELARDAFAVLMDAHVVGIMDTVTSLELTGVELEALVPAQVSNNLPNLIKLCLRDSTITLQSATALSLTGVPSKLQCLQLHDVNGGGSQHVWQGSLKQQLAELTALTNLQLWDLSSVLHSKPLYNSILKEVMATVSSQLTRLDLCMLGDPDRTPWLSSYLSSNKSALKELSLASIDIRDEDMPALLSFPWLERLSVKGFYLDKSWAGLHCRWRELSCCYSTEALAHLPIHDKLLLKGVKGEACVALSLGATTSIQPAITAMAKSKIQGWDAIQVTDTEHSVVIPEDVPVLDQRFIQALPLLSSAKDLKVCIPGLSSKSFCAFLGARAGQKQSLCLQIECSCEAAVADLAVVVSRMPAGSKLVLDRLEADERTVTELCCAIMHSIELHVHIRPLSEGYERRVQAAVLQRGHQGVTLETDFDFEPKSQLPRWYVKVQHTWQKLIADACYDSCRIACELRLAKLRVD